MAGSFVPATELSAGFYRDVVEPLVRPYPHAAALLGWGSDVLGYDTVRSTDHGWGPRLQVFVAAGHVDAATAAVEDGLPATYRDWPVVFGWDRQRPRHHVDVTTLTDWTHGHLGVAAGHGMTARDWLLTPQQLLLGVVRGVVHADPDGRLRRLRDGLAWYPHDVWLWLLACGWRRLAQQEHLVGRAAEVGDELGSRLLAGRLVHDVMRLAFLLERRYAPYPKWLGTAFAELTAAPSLTPALRRALHADDWPSRQDALVHAYQRLAERHGATGVTGPVEPTVRPFHDRPFQVLDSGRFVDACLAEVRDDWLLGLPLVGSVDQLTDATDALCTPAVAHRLSGVYG